MANKTAIASRIGISARIWIVYHLIFFTTAVYFVWQYCYNPHIGLHRDWLLVPIYVYLTVTFINFVTGFFSAMWNLW